MATLPSIPENLQNLPVLRKFLDDLRTAMLIAIDAGSGGGGGGGGDINSDGSVPFAANESMGGFKLTNVGTPVAGTDAANRAFVDSADVIVAAAAAAAEALDLRLNGSRVMTGALNMNTHLINNVVDPVAAQDAATKNYVDNKADKFAASRIVSLVAGEGTDTTIAAAIAALPAAGGDIYVKGGTYTISSPLDFTTKVVRLRGAGTSVNFTSSPTYLVISGAISLFKNGEQGCSVEDITVEGDNATAQVFYEGSAEVRFTRINVHDVGGIIKFASSQPEILFRDSYINVPSGPAVGNRYLWKGSAANGTLIFDNVELFITGSGATIMSGVTASANGPTFKVVNSYVGGGGGGGSTNFWFAQVVDWSGFDLDNAEFEVSGARSNIVNSNFLDFDIKFKAIWNFITNCNFSQGGTGSGGTFDAQVTFAPSFPGISQENFISNCNFYGNSASLRGLRLTSALNTVVTGCLFTSHSSSGINVTGTATLSVTGCRFTESVPVNEAATTVTGLYSDNSGFVGAIIIGVSSQIGDVGSIFIAENKDVATIKKGQPVSNHSSGTGVVRAIATSTAGEVIGVANEDIAVGEKKQVLVDGRMYLATWVDATGAASLTAEATYYLDTTAAKISTTAPSVVGQIVQVVGKTASPNILVVKILDSILL